jgi:hypothetical protein
MKNRTFKLNAEMSQQNIFQKLKHQAETHLTTY